MANSPRGYLERWRHGEGAAHGSVDGNGGGTRVAVKRRLGEAAVALEQDREVARGAARYLWPVECVGGKATKSHGGTDVDPPAALGSPGCIRKVGEIADRSGPPIGARGRARGHGVSEGGEEKGRKPLTGPAHGRRGADGPPRAR